MQYESIVVGSSLANKQNLVSQPFTDPKTQTEVVSINTGQVGFIMFKMRMRHYSGASLESAVVRVNVTYNCEYLAVFPSSSSPSETEV